MNKIFEWLGFGTLKSIESIVSHRRYIPEFWPMREGPTLYAEDESLPTKAWNMKTERGPVELRDL